MSCWPCTEYMGVPADLFAFSSAHVHGLHVRAAFSFCIVVHVHGLHVRALASAHVHGLHVRALSSLSFAFALPRNGFRQRCRHLQTVHLFLSQAEYIINATLMRNVAMCLRPGATQLRNRV